MALGEMDDHTASDSSDAPPIKNFKIKSNASQQASRIFILSFKDTIPVDLAHDMYSSSISSIKTLSSEATIPLYRAANEPTPKESAPCSCDFTLEVSTVQFGFNFDKRTTLQRKTVCRAVDAPCEP
jgi:hypothetical protein